MPRRAAPHRGLDVHYGDMAPGGADASLDHRSQHGPADDLTGDAADDPADDPVDKRPSKTQLKQQAKAQQTLGAELAALSEDRLAAIDMPEALRSQYQYYTQADVTKLKSTGYAGGVTPLREAVVDYVRNYLVPGRPFGDAAVD